MSICPINAIKFVNDILTIDNDLCIKCGLCYACCHRSFYPKELDKNQVEIKTNTKFLKEFNHFKDIFSAQTKDVLIKNVAQD